MAGVLTAKKLIAALGVTEENIFAEAARMAILFARAARYRVDTMRKKAVAEAALDACTSRLSLMYRARPSGKGKTEAYFKARIALNPRYQRLSRAKEDANHREELAKLIIDAYKMRRDAIKVIGEHRGLENIREESMFENSRQVRKLKAVVRSLDDRRKHSGVGDE